MHFTLSYVVRQVAISMSFLVCSKELSMRSARFLNNRRIGTIYLRNSLKEGSNQISLIDAENGLPSTYNWYTCGPTVYDFAHIGHARTYVCCDVIRRILVNVFKVNIRYAMGLTDIDDKIIAKAISRGFTNWNEVNKLTSEYTSLFFNDLDALNVLRPNVLLKVTNHIPDIINYIERIIQNGNAYYVPNSGVYFDVGNFKSNGKLGFEILDNSNDSPWLEEDDEITKRILVKRDRRDFALWKCVSDVDNKNQSEVSSNHNSTNQNLTFNSPWGKGRPGKFHCCSGVFKLL